MRRQSKTSKRKSKNTSEYSEFDSWDRQASDKTFDWSKATLNVFPNLKPSTKSSTIRWPDPLLNRIKILANRRNIPYQTLVKVVMADFVGQELRKAS